MTGLDITPHGVHRTLRTRNIVIGATVGLALVVGVGTVAARGDPSVEKVASTSPIASSGSVYTQPAYVPSTPVFPPAPIVPTPKSAPVYVPPAPVRVTAPTSAPAPVQTAAPAPVQSGPHRLSLGWSTVITQSDSTAKVGVGTPKFATTDKYAVAPDHGFYAVFPVQASGVTGSFDVNPLYFYVRGADGTHYDPTYASGFDPILSSSLLAPGEPYRGNIIFDLPSKSGTLVYEAGLGTNGVEWKF